MGDLILGITGFCFLQLFLMVGKGLNWAIFSIWIDQQTGNSYWYHWTKLVYMTCEA